MPRRRYKPEEIVAKLRQVDVLVSQGQSMADAIRQIGVSEVACETNCSTARYSTRCGKPRSSSRAGVVTTTLFGRMLLSATNHQHRRSSCPHSPRGRLRYVERLRRPRWRNRQRQTNIPSGPLNEGWSQYNTWREIVALYRLTQPAINLRPRYNIAPTTIRGLSMRYSKRRESQSAIDNFIRN